MLVAIGLGIIGLLLIYFEFFAPGGILGVLGGLSVIAGLILCIWTQSSFVWILLYVIGIILMLILTIRLALWKIKRTQEKSHFYLGKDQEGYVAASYDQELIGKSGMTLTPLTPSGHINIQDKPYQAVSEGGYIKKGTQIKIVGGECARFIVKEDI